MKRKDDMANEQRAQDFARNLKAFAFDLARKQVPAVPVDYDKLFDHDRPVTNSVAIALDYAHKHVSDALGLIYAGIRKGEYQAGAHGATERLRRMLTELVEIGNQFDEEGGQ